MEKKKRRMEMWDNAESSLSEIIVYTWMQRAGEKEVYWMYCN